MGESVSSLLSWEGYFKRWQDEYLYDYASNVNTKCWEQFKKEMLAGLGTPLPNALKELDHDRYKIFVSWFEESQYFLEFLNYVKKTWEKYHFYPLAV